MRALFERVKRFLPAVLAALVAAGITVAVTSGGGGTTVTIKVPVPLATQLAVPHGDTQADDPLPTGDPAESALRDETPPGVTEPPVNELERKLAELNRPRPVGGAQNYSCREDYSGHVYSSRFGASVLSFKLHYTVSPNVLGWGDVFGIRDYFKRTRVGSSHLIVDFEGHCLQMVPWSEASWTQGNFNRTSDSVEIIATRRETRAEWLNSPLFREGILAAIVRDRLRARGLPLRFVDPVGCTDQRGYTDHNHLECSNNHTDVAPNFPFDVFQRQLTDGALPKHKYRSRTLREGLCGTDVQRFQGFLSHRPPYRGHRGVERTGCYDAETERGRHRVTYALGFPRGAVRREYASERTQHFVRHPDKRPPGYKALAKRRAELAAER